MQPPVLWPHICSKEAEQERGVPKRDGHDVGELQFAKILAEAAKREPEAGDLMPMPGSTLARRFRHNAPLVTQLMAVKMDLPQVRARRRAGNEEGVAAYGATGETIVKGRRGKGPSWAA